MKLTKFNLLVWVPVEIKRCKWDDLPITVAALPEAWNVFARSNTGVVGSNSTRGMDVCVSLFCVCAVLCAGSGLAEGSFLVQGVLTTV
jgi:hypothetical protein